MAPPGITMLTGPVVAAAFTVKVIWVDELTTNPDCETPLTRTAVAPSRLVPVMTTTVPVPPLLGAMLVMATGAAVNVPLPSPGPGGPRLVSTAAP